MNAGRLRHRVMLQHPTTVPDDSGGFDESWATTATVWARVEVDRGAERLQRDAMAGTQWWKVTLRLPRAFGVVDRVVWEGRTLTVEAVQPDALEQWLVLRCREDRAA